MDCDEALEHAWMLMANVDPGFSCMPNACSDRPAHLSDPPRRTGPSDGESAAIRPRGVRKGSSPRLVTRCQQRRALLIIKGVHCWQKMSSSSTIVA